MATEAAAQGHETENRRRRLIGRVRSDKMDKKYVRVRARYKAHDEKNEFKTGDRVEIIEHKPISKDKRWKVIRLVERPAAELTLKEREAAT
jgi:small subunit ribosomal protein S17